MSTAVYWQEVSKICRNQIGEISKSFRLALVPLEGVTQWKALLLTGTNYLLSLGNQVGLDLRTEHICKVLMIMRLLVIGYRCRDIPCHYGY